MPITDQPMRGKQINNVFLTKALKIENIVTKKKINALVGVGEA